ncbi:MAG: hypothetical protein H6765_04220 [Candidatus Peribacteria bacterium]|nr:MAG: hypothetical protein H6765_04220 [Candidatus Peribacteria bacterium]
MQSEPFGRMLLTYLVRRVHTEKSDPIDLDALIAQYHDEAPSGTIVRETQEET